MRCNRHGRRCVLAQRRRSRTGCRRRVTVSLRTMNIDNLRDIAIDLYIDFYNKIYCRKKLQGNFIDKDNTISCIVNSNRSVIRFGDGECSMYFGYDIYFQKNRNGLDSKIKYIFNNTINDKRFIFCMSHERFSGSINEICNKSINRYNVWKKSRYLYLRKVNDNNVYDAYAFKGLSAYQYKYIVDRILSFKKIIVISSHNDIAREFFIYYGYTGSVNFIGIPTYNAYELYDDIYSDIIKCINNDSLVLLSCGPLAKILCYQLTINQTIVYDVGKFFLTEFKKNFTKQ